MPKRAAAVEQDLTLSKRTKLEKYEDCCSDDEEKTRKSIVFENFSFEKFPEFWPYLEIRGPLPKTKCIGVELLQNRQLVVVFREITEQIHENFLNFRETVKRELRKRVDVPVIDEILEIVERMCCETMKVDHVYFDVFGITELIRNCLETSTTQLDSEDFPVMLNQLRRIMAKRDVKVTEENLINIRNELLRHFFIISADLVSWLVLLKRSSVTNRIVIKGFSLLEIFPNRHFLNRSDFDVLASAAFLDNVFVSNQISRHTIPVSLWTSIPCEHDDNEYLLKHVFEWGLIQLFPEDVKSFLTTWMIKVRRRMRKRLKREDLHRVIGAALEMNIDQEKLETNINHPAIRKFLKKINDNVLNCLDNFEIFGEKWADSVLEFVQESRSGSVSLEQMEEFVDASRIETKATAHLASMFNKSLLNECLLPHTLLQLYRFLIYFSYATIRHVFSSTSSDQIVFEWSLEEDVIDYTKIDEFGKQGKKEETKELTSIGTEIRRPTDSLNESNNWLDSLEKLV